MKKSNLENYWNKYYSKKISFKHSSFAKFIFKFIKNKKFKTLIDIGCGSGRDSFFFASKGYKVTSVDISKEVIKLNSKKNFSNPKFIKFNVGKDKLNRKFDIIYSRFFLHAIDEKTENNLIKIINSIKKNSLICFEFRNDKDKIFKKFKTTEHNKIIEFEKGHYRRIINSQKIIEKFKKTIKSRLIYERSSKNLSIYKNDNPNLTRIIFKT